MRLRRGAFVSASINYACNKEEEGRSRPIPALLQPSLPFPGSLRKDTCPERNRRGLRLPMAPKKRLLLLRPHFTQLKAQRCFKGTKRLDWWRARASPDGCREEGAGSVLRHRGPRASARTSARQTAPAPPLPAALAEARNGTAPHTHPAWPTQPGVESGRSPAAL